MNNMTQKNINYYLALNYEVTLRKMTRAEAGAEALRYLAQIPLIEGLIAEGATPQEALANLEAVKQLAFELMLKQGKKIPEPVFEAEAFAA